MEQRWTFPGVAGQPTFSQEDSDDSSKRSQKTPDGLMVSKKQNKKQN